MKPVEDEKEKNICSVSNSASRKSCDCVRQRGSMESDQANSRDSDSMDKIMKNERGKLSKEAVKANDHRSLSC